MSSRRSLFADRREKTERDFALMRSLELPATGAMETLKLDAVDFESEERAMSGALLELSSGDIVG
jgi:hypothetical protein